MLIDNWRILLNDRNKSRYEVMIEINVSVMDQKRLIFTLQLYDE